MGHLNGCFAPRGGNLNKPIFKRSNARGVAGGVLDLQFDWYIMEGHFSVQLADESPFGRILVDQTTKGTVNQDTKTTGNVSRFSLMTGAVNRFYLTAEYRCAFLDQ